MHDLLAAVDDLTKPVIDHIAQKTDAGMWIRAVTVEHPPLLDQLREAGSGRTSPGSNRGKHERSPIDLDAAFMHAQYAAQIGDWCRMVGVKPSRSATESLRAWYAATRALNDFNGDGYQTILVRWAHTIRAHFDPPEKFEAKQPCPICGASTWGDQINGGGRAIEISYRLTDTRDITGERALCRPCNTVWQGGDAVRELAEEMQEKRDRIG